MKCIDCRIEKGKRNLRCNSCAQKERFKHSSVWNKGLKGVQVAWNKGDKWPEQTKQKMSESAKAKFARGFVHPMWKGNMVSYDGLHRWVKRHLGKADHCSFNSSHKARFFNWANVSGAYLRDLGDWTQLCPKCHKQYDSLRGSTVSNFFERTFSANSNHYSRRRVN